MVSKDADNLLTLKSDVFTHAQQAFDSGHYVEAVSILHNVIELLMNGIFHFYYSKLVNNSEFKFFKYSVIAEILASLALVKSNELGELRKFNTKRNNLAHEYFSGKIKECDAKEGFELGKKLLSTLSQKMGKIATSTELQEIERIISAKLAAFVSSL